MMRWRDIPLRDWRLIHQQLVWLIAAMLFAGLLLLLSQGLLHYNQRQLRPLQARLNEVRAAAETAQIALQATRENKQRYQALDQRGVIGKGEHRLAWVEHLAKLRRTEPELRLRYQIDAQRPLGQSEVNGNSALFASQMSLQYAVLHEGHFSRLHQSLTRLPGWPAPKHCELSRATETSTLLNVDCDYEWLSIGPAPTGEDAAK